MLKGIIFDLDETLVDSTALKNFRDRRDWNSCYSSLNSSYLYKGTNDLLEFCKEKGVKIGIVTMAPRKYAYKILKFHHINYDCLIAYHDVTKRKPHSEPMIKCLEALKLKANEVISFGDDLKDLSSSLNAGIKAFGVSWGVQDRNTLLKGGAEEVFDEFEQIGKFINKEHSFN
ncbi:HAD family hydrolase [Halobacillus salinarum]|uniref:HAD family hydrolase n=1 Tax=Halobacillus salinarum TaxID=2932257 RepID=A0ABY4EH52_9BACI|nr:HAD family hydrolase [Halobacillus salinarum]UOQ43392.1 HAD family hydrolase [Halobacillus salinarum]